MAKPLTGTYQPDKRTMFKIKHQRTADCVVAGYRLYKTGDDAIGSLLLGLYNDDGDLASVGRDRRVPGSSAQDAVHRAAAAGHHVRRPSVGLGAAARGRTDTAELRVQPVEQRQGPVVRAAAARAVVEVRYEHMEGERFRHTAQFNRWRPDREPRSCTYEQLEEPVKYDLADILTGSPR